MKLLLSIILFFSFLTATSQVKFDSLWSAWNNPLLPDTARLEAIQEIAWNGFLYTKPDSTFYCAQLAYDFSKTKGLKKYMATAVNIQGASWAGRGEYAEAIKYYNKSLKLREEIDDKDGIAKSLCNIGIIYKNQGDIPKALVYYHKSLKIQEQLGNKDGIAAALTNIGIIYKGQEDFTNAMEYYTRSLKIREELNDTRGLGYELNNIAILYVKQKDFESAFLNYNKALNLFESINDKKGQALSLVNIGSAYEEQGDLNTALANYTRSVEIRKTIGDKRGITRGLQNIANIYYKLGIYNKAIDFGSQSLKMANDLKLPSEIRDAAETLYKSYKTTGNQAQALKNYELYILMKDSLVNDDIKNELIKQEYQIKEDSIRVQQEKKDALAKAEQKRKDDIAQKETEKKNLLITAGILGSILGLIFTLLIFNRLQITRKQKVIIEEQKLIVEEKNTEILDSIKYAKRIQSAILPPDKLVKEYLPESFILYKPKDIVAGDFYWMESSSSVSSKGGETPFPLGRAGDGIVLFAAADCTGHGVPGAMVSVVCNNGLNRAVREYGLTDPGLILNKTREIVIEEFEKSDDDVKDGMDIALCSLSTVSSSNGVYRELSYAGANNPLWIIRNGEILETKADKQPIGKHTENIPFTTHSFELQKGDTIYIFSDGYVDQFGGEKGKKLKTKAFKELLLNIQNKDMESQKTILNNVFEDWKGNLSQIDDVCIIGVRI
ncbi:MAG: tetratricopeptide repeat protein [Flavobacteriales bacterium]|nr:tetratricopeptide repeat protein [Flavobacteriales bacterium]